MEYQELSDLLDSKLEPIKQEIEQIKSDILDIKKSLSEIDATLIKSSADFGNIVTKISGQDLNIIWKRKGGDRG